MRRNGLTVAALFVFVVGLAGGCVKNHGGSMTAELVKGQAKAQTGTTAQTGTNGGTVTADLIHKAQFIALLDVAYNAGACTAKTALDIATANGLTLAEIEDIEGRKTIDGHYGRPLTAAQKFTFIKALDKTYNAGGLDTETALHIFKACGVTCLDFEAFAVKRIEVAGGDTEAQRQAAQQAKDVYCTANGQE
jgi:hypothetical protein